MPSYYEFFFHLTSLPVTNTDQVIVLDKSSSVTKESNNNSNPNASPSHIPVSKARQRRRQKVVTTVAVNKKNSEVELFLLVIFLIRLIRNAQLNLHFKDFSS